MTQYPVFIQLHEKFELTDCGATVPSIQKTVNLLEFTHENCLFRKILCENLITKNISYICSFRSFFFPRSGSSSSLHSLLISCFIKVFNLKNCYGMKLISLSKYIKFDSESSQRCVSIHSNFSCSKYQNTCILKLYNFRRRFYLRND